MSNIYSQIEQTRSIKTVSSYDQIAGWMNFEKAYDFAVANGKDGDCFLEIGCFLGRSTAYLANEIKKSGKNIKLYVVDPFKVNLLDDNNLTNSLPANDFFKLFKKNLNDMDLFEGIEIFRTTSDKAYDLLNKLKFKFIFIDGIHESPFVDNDIKNYSQLLTNDGIIAGDDYRANDVERAVKNQFGENYFVSNNNWPFWSSKKIV